MPRARILPVEDALLSAAEACALVHVSRSRFDAYAKRFPALIRGRRIVHANPNGKGVVRYLRSAVIAHMHVELTYDRALAPVVDEAAVAESDEQEES